MKNLKKLLLALAIMMVIGGAVRPALSYFTTYTRAKGSVTIHLEETNQIKERVEDLTKYISVKNTGTPAVYVRARAFVANGFKYVYEDQTGGKWTGPDEGWYYYMDPVAPGAETGELKFTITDLPEGTIGQTDFNVVIVYESAPVILDENGNPLPATSEAVWSQVRVEGGQ